MRYPDDMVSYAIASFIFSGAFFIFICSIYVMTKIFFAG